MTEIAIRVKGGTIMDTTGKARRWKPRWTWTIDTRRRVEAKGTIPVWSAQTDYPWLDQVASLTVLKNRDRYR